jgi:hypothetical protein
MGAVTKMLRHWNLAKKSVFYQLIVLEIEIILKFGTLNIIPF